MPRVIDRFRQDAADRLKSIVPLRFRYRLVRWRLRMRVRTAPLRTTPDLLIIGGQRCGTSSLYKWLGRHPNVAPSLRKEIEYFSVAYDRGERWYLAHFPLKIRRTIAGWTGRRFITFEATPDYVFDPRVPARVKALLPDVRLILLLRQPSDRAVSHYHHMERLGLEPLDLETALRTEEERIAPEWDKIEADPSYEAVDLRRYSYVARSRYAEQIERWLEHFPQEQILVLRSEDLFGDTEATFDRILNFLDIPRWHPPEFRNYSYVNALDGNYPDPPPEVAALLADLLDEPNRRLTALLGEDIAWETQAER